MKLLSTLTRAVGLTLALASLLGAAQASGGSGGGGGGGTTTSSTSSGNVDELPGEILVKLRSTDALPGLLQRQSLALLSRFGARPIYRLKVIGNARVKDVLANLALEPDVMIAETNRVHRAPEASRVAGNGAWAIGNGAWAIGTQTSYATQWAPQSMRVPQALTLSRGAGVRVAVLDTGIDPGHPLFAGRLLPGKDFVDGDNDPSETFNPATGAWGHGTHVAGLIATVAPDARILPLRVLDVDGAGNAWVLAEAILYALDPDGNPATDDGAHIINLSLGTLTRTRLLDTIAQLASCAPAVPDDAIGDRSDPGYRDDEIRCAGSQGALVIAAAGNDASSSLKEYPAAEGAYGLLSVAATTSRGRLASFSNSGPWIDVAAPGEAVTSSVPGGLWASWSGTSMASPLAAGTAALVRAAAPSLAPRDVATRLKRTASLLCGTNLRQIDAYAAVANIEPPSGNCK